jgi:hypothetical protein
MESSFLQSEMWRKFQEAVGHRTLSLSGKVSGISIFHSLAVVGEYLYFPHGPVLDPSLRREELKNELIHIGNKENASWLRLEPRNENELALYQEAFWNSLT